MAGLLYAFMMVAKRCVVIYIKRYYIVGGSEFMAYSYNEYRLRQINELLSILGDVDTVEREELLLERDSILHELRHNESLPHSIK